MFHSNHEFQEVMQTNSLALNRDPAESISKQRRP